MRFGLSQRIDGGMVDRGIAMPPGSEEFEVLKLRGRGKYNIGVAGSIRHEMLDHDCEQVLAFKPLLHTACAPSITSRRRGTHPGSSVRSNLDTKRSQIRERQHAKSARKAKAGLRTTLTFNRGVIGRNEAGRFFRAAKALERQAYRMLANKSHLFEPIRSDHF